MGSDNLFQKRKQNAANSSTRRKACRARYDKVLIVCEGSKTEPLYFEELIDHYEINTANVQISGECGSDPLSVVNHGIALYKKETSDPFDRVYCLFDQDSHNNYQDARNKISSLTPANTFFAIPSVPCFEYWLLLNFKYTTGPYSSTKIKSIGKAVEAALKEHWPNYKKGNKGTFTYTFCLKNDELNFAKDNAKRALNEAIAAQTDNPTTYIHELVDYLTKH
ncbi:MAG: RloB family protein [Methylococcaceae bacterium]|jgi:hypothetical protein